MDEVKLKPCPFCGGEASIVTMHNENLSWIRYKAVCGICLAETSMHEKWKMAKAVWNRRAYEKQKDKSE